MQRIKFIFLFSLVLFSCKEKTDEKKFTINNFYKIRIDTLKPDQENIYYFASIIRLKGYVNDSIKIESNNRPTILLSKNIDTIIRTDYYGINNVINIFRPYKATNGNLEIEYVLAD